MLNCREITRLVGDFLDRRLSLSERWKFLLHIAMCRGCRTYVEQMRLTLRALAHVRPRGASEAQRDWLARGFGAAFGRTVALAACGALLVASMAQADPGIVVRYFSGVPHLSLEGDYAQTHYTVWRAPAASGPWERVTDENVLCTGECYVDDFSAEPGATYWYRFELVPVAGAPVTYGPYAVTLSPTLVQHVRVTVTPNPGVGPSRLQLAVAAGPARLPVRVELRLYDLQGRSVARIYSGALASNRATIAWDGRSDDGRPLSAGVYLLVANTDVGSAVSRVVRAR